MRNLIIEIKKNISWINIKSHCCYFLEKFFFRETKQGTLFQIKLDKLNRPTSKFNKKLEEDLNELTESQNHQSYLACRTNKNERLHSIVDMYFIGVHNKVIQEGSASLTQ